jgi:hypothetical protein
MKTYDYIIRVSKMGSRREDDETGPYLPEGGSQRLMFSGQSRLLGLLG